jgi:hypothetical protein
MITAANHHIWILIVIVCRKEEGGLSSGAQSVVHQHAFISDGKLQ